MDLDLDWPDKPEQQQSPRTLPPREPSGVPKPVKPVVVVLLAVFLFVVGLSIGDNAGERAARDAEAARQEAENRVEIVTAERDSLEASLTVLTERVETLESELASATAAAELWETRALDASATAAAVQEDNEALKRQLKQQSSATQSDGVKQAGGWQTAKASWYGPGLYGNTTADGTLFTADTWCVAHKTLPFGTVVQITYGGKTVDVPVRDRGPYVAGREFDVSAAVARSLGFSGVHPIEWRVRP